MNRAAGRLPEAQGVIMLAVDDVPAALAFYQAMGYVQEQGAQGGPVDLVPPRNGLPAVSLTGRPVSTLLRRRPAARQARTRTTQSMPLPNGTVTVIRDRLTRDLYQNDLDQPEIAVDLRANRSRS